MTKTLLAIALLVAIILIVGIMGHLLLLAAVAGGGFLVGSAHAKGKLALGRKRSHGSLGR